MTNWTRLATLLLCCASAMQTARAQQPGNLQAVLDRIHQHAGNDAWRTKGFQDAKIEAWLDNLAGSIAKAAKIPDLKVPVRLADVRPADPAPSGTISQRLIVGKNLDLKELRLQNSIVLADGHVELNQAVGCVIVARGAVKLQRSEYSVIAAGLLVEIGTDGRANDAANGSIIASRGWARLQRAYGSIIAAPEGASVESPQDTFFLNAAIVNGGFGRSDGIEAKSLKVPDLPLEPLPANPLAKQLQAVGIIRPDAGQRSSIPGGMIADGRAAVGAPAAFGAGFGRGGAAAPPVVDLGIVIRYDGRRYVAPIDQPILDEAGQVVEALRDWKLVQRTGSLAIFSSPTGDLAVRLPGTR